MRLAYFSVPPPPNANRWVECNGTSVFFVRQHARTNGILGQTTLGHLKRRYAHFRVRRARKMGFSAVFCSATAVRKVVRKKTWTYIGKLSQSQRKKVIVTKCVACTVFPLRTVERRPWSIFYPLKKHKTGRFSPIRVRNQFFHKRDPYPNGKCFFFCQNNVWVR